MRVFKFVIRFTLINFSWLAFNFSWLAKRFTVMIKGLIRTCMYTWATLAAQVCLPVAKNFQIDSCTCFEHSRQSRAQH